MPRPYRKPILNGGGNGSSLAYESDNTRSTAKSINKGPRYDLQSSGLNRDLCQSYSWCAAGGRL